MNTPISWIKDYVPELDCTDKEYYDRMTLSGTKVENWKNLDHNCEKIVVGRVEAMEKHPDADKLIETIGNHHQFHYLGQIDMEQRINDFDYLLLFSEKEGLPLVLIEACMHGIPMITNAIPAVLEINEDKRTGYVFEDMDKLLAGINHLPQPHSEAYRGMSHNARKKYDIFFREETMIKAYKDLIVNTIYQKHNE